MNQKPLGYIGKIITMIAWRFRNGSHGRVISKFAKKTGLLYFGFVNQHSDDHKIVRGLTVSSTHQDNHYSVGSVGDYNISVVDRSDYIVEPHNKTFLHNWLIFAIELKTETPVPHFFIGAKNRDLQPFSALFSTFPNMKEVEMGSLERYDAEFTNRFSVYARPAKSVDVQKIISAKIARSLGAHFWPLSIEQHNNVLYIYSTNTNITSGLLDTMLENGLWLSAQIDAQASKE